MLGKFLICGWELFNDIFVITSTFIFKLEWNCGIFWDAQMLLENDPMIIFSVTTTGVLFITSKVHVLSKHF